MSNNGSNNWNVPYSDITWLQRFLLTHPNSKDVTRHDDIVFELDRLQQSDHLKVFCCRQYAMGLTLVHRALSEFGPLNIIYVGGGWNGYTQEAKKFCLEQQIGLYVTNEMSGALWKNDYWTFHQRGEDGNPKYFFRD